MTFQSGDDYDVTDVAAAMLFVENRVAMHEQARRRIFEALKACPGDFIVLLPTVVYGRSAWCCNRAQISTWFSQNYVKLCYVGATVSVDVQHVLGTGKWQSSRIYGADALAEVIEGNKDMVVSIFDAMRLGLSVDVVEALQRQCFPNRSACTLKELVPHLNDSRVLRLVLKKLNFDPASRSNKTDLSPIRKALGV